MTNPSILVVAGEVSGDIHAGNLLRALATIEPQIQAFGIGGNHARAAGLECLASTDDLAHMGLVEVIRELPNIRRIMRRLVDQATDRRPDLAVLIDSPDFNLRLASRLHRLAIPVILYVSPQLWAWRRGRVRTVRRLAREVLCILPFEVGFYRDHGVPARYVGHPLVDEIARIGLLGQSVKSSKKRLALLPGSRLMEVRQLLPVMLDALRRIPDEVIDDAVLVEAPGMSAVIDKLLLAAPRDPRLRRASGELRRAELAASGSAWTASGTATLECALLDVPMIVGYRLQPLSYALARLLVRVPHVALVNLIAESSVVPELLQGDWNPTRLANTAIELLAEEGRSQRAGLRTVRDRLGSPGASPSAARAITEHISRT